MVGGRLLLFDIGGGSMEIALGRDAGPDLALSLPLGAGRLTRAMLPHDPPKRSEVKELRRYVRETLCEVVDRLRWESVPRNVVATSKTFKQLARLAGAPPQREGPFVRRTLTAVLPRLGQLLLFLDREQHEQAEQCTGRCRGQQPQHHQRADARRPRRACAAGERLRCRGEVARHRERPGPPAGRRPHWT
ncbi:hypothetical protein GCM10022267_08050 [Lentzea roselyniae]|uniref:Ppx/GppA phosphatase N-terminal domain-containing protein n=1 Tax=Lentzea roselyniae TaxID=531940 RepID=A0ABP7A3Q7_9PSEU